EYLADYLDALASFSRKLTEAPENEKLAYYRKLFSYLSVDNPNMQAVYEAYITEALKNDDFAKLHSVFLHSARVKMLPAGVSGYDHCDRLWPMLDLLACDDFENIYRALPAGLPLSANGYPMYIHGTNLLLCLLYNSESAVAYPLDRVMDKAEKFASSKKALWERSVISCLLGILQGDVSRISDSLQQTCAGFSKVDAARYMKMQCQNVYGLVILAKHFLPEVKFAQIIYPEYKNFSKGYMLWLLEQKKMPKTMCVSYASAMEGLNELLVGQIAVTCIHQPYLNSDNSYLSAKDKKAYYMDLDKMLAELIR
ncbi:MAG: hypothetical protein K2O34_05755, partial [Acetatifactor sp.]|nr:hypothetical protein [Acetatifactor sp.]